jgi:Zn-dependent peptidase ImmA (M78 family)
MVAVPVKGAVLQWARKERGLSLEKAAEATGLPVAKIQAFEKETTSPSIGDLEKLASGYQIAFASLLMPDPLAPSTRPKIADFRIHHGGAAPEWGYELSVAADVINQHLSDLADLVEADGSLSLPVRLPHLKLADDVEAKAKQERERIGMSVDEQLRLETPSEAFKRWRYIIEQSGILVYLMDLGDWRTCRGYSVFDHPRLPAIIINNDEMTAGARLFTLVHEYAHLLLRQAGLSDHNRTNKVEAFCNTFAAHFLMPREAFTIAARAAQKVPSKYWTDADLRRLADMFGVSMSAAALQLEQLGIVPAGLYEIKAQEWASRKPRKGGAPIPYAERQVSRLGVRHVELVLTALEKGYLNQIEAYDLTEVNPKHFPSLRTELKQRQEQYGGS